MNDLLLITPRPIDFGFGCGPVQPFNQCVVRESDLRKALEHNSPRVPVYNHKGVKIRDIIKNMTPGLAAAYERKHGAGMIHRSYLGTGAIVEPFTVAA